MWHGLQTEAHLALNTSKYNAFSNEPQYQKLCRNFSWSCKAPQAFRDSAKAYLWAVYFLKVYPVHHQLEWYGYCYKPPLMVLTCRRGIPSERKDLLYVNRDTVEGKKSGQWQASGGAVVFVVMDGCLDKCQGKQPHQLSDLCGLVTSLLGGQQHDTRQYEVGAGVNGAHCYHLDTAVHISHFSSADLHGVALRHRCILEHSMYSPLYKHHCSFPMGALDMPSAGLLLAV